MTTYTVIDANTGDAIESGMTLLDAFNLATGWNVETEDEVLAGIKHLARSAPYAHNHTIRTDEDADLYFRQRAEGDGSTCAPAVLL